MKAMNRRGGDTGRALSVVLVVAGLALLAAAAWLLAPAAGLATAGVGCWVLEWRLAEGQK